MDVATGRVAATARFAVFRDGARLGGAVASSRFFAGFTAPRLVVVFAGVVAFFDVAFRELPRDGADRAFAAGAAFAVTFRADVFGGTAGFGSERGCFADDFLAAAFSVPTGTFAAARFPAAVVGTDGSTWRFLEVLDVATWPPHRLQSSISLDFLTRKLPEPKPLVNLFLNATRVAIEIVSY